MLAVIPCWHHVLSMSSHTCTCRCCWFAHLRNNDTAHMQSEGVNMFAEGQLRRQAASQQAASEQVQVHSATAAQVKITEEHEDSPGRTTTSETMSSHAIGGIES